MMYLYFSRLPPDSCEMLRVRTLARYRISKDTERMLAQVNSCANPEFLRDKLRPNCFSRGYPMLGLRRTMTRAKSFSRPPDTLVYPQIVIKSPKVTPI